MIAAHGRRADPSISERAFLFPGWLQVHMIPIDHRDRQSRFRTSGVSGSDARAQSSPTDPS